jgi:hypothetical protein
LQAAAHHQLAALQRRSDRSDHQRDVDKVGELARRLNQLNVAIAKLPPASVGKLNKAVGAVVCEFFDSETFASMNHCDGRRGVVAQAEAESYRCLGGNL